MSYADDNTPYVIADDINGLITSLEEVTKVLFEWSENDLLKRNAEECDFFFNSNIYTTFKRKKRTITR